ncbi:S26 family signal peptidase [Micromonospora zhanjiangensis]|uniref:Mitochondrial inner membrane protease subunit 2 n=1 Tax=Micromonospora zhanjiangensis TaxID=1522057 RepID=A0ABV8KP99_9ACTN
MIPYLIATIALVLLLAAVAWIRRRLLVIDVHGPSMLPTYRDGDRLLTRRRTADDPLSPGQVVVLRNPRPVGLPGSSTGHWLVKRIAAVAGDRLLPGMPDGHVPNGHVLVLGDNPAQSLDSRHFGLIPSGTILGTVVRPMGNRRQTGRPGTVGGESTRPTTSGCWQEPASNGTFVGGVDVDGVPPLGRSP